MNDIVDLRIYHGGSFVQDPRLRYINGEVDEVTTDPDLICVPHLMKFIAHERFVKVESLSYKLTMEPMEKLRPFFNDIHTLELMMIDEPEVVPYSEFAPQLASNVNQSQGDPDGGVVTQPEQEGITIEEENEGNPSEYLEEKNEDNEYDDEENNDDELDEGNKDDEENYEHEYTVQENYHGVEGFEYEVLFNFHA
nr:putative FBD-associated F-box protein At1g61330 [Ipomoea batatas]